METLQTKTTEPGLQPMARFNFEAETGHCLRHGLFDNFRTPVGLAGCPRCNSEQWAQKESEKQITLEEERRQQWADHLLRKAAIPLRFKDRTLDNFLSHADGPRQALEVAKDYADRFDEMLKSGTSLVLCGGVGAGKTHLAIGIAHRVIAKSRMAVFTSVLGAIRSVKETYRKGSEITEAEAIDNLTKPDLLILDEVGVQFGSDTEKMILFEIINGRYEKLRPTIVISNLAKDALTEYLGERVVDRLREGGGRMVIFDWGSYRRIAQ